jgi:hypothetical protein
MLYGFAMFIDSNYLLEDLEALVERNYLEFLVRSSDIDL